MEQLDNLVRAGSLHPEPPDQSEFDGMIAAASQQLEDAAVPNLSIPAQFTLTYGSAHTAALAALRWHGYRPRNQRYIVFLCLVHTVGFDEDKCRLLGESHRMRNLAEYDGHIEIGETFLSELKVVTAGLLPLVKALGPTR